MSRRIEIAELVKEFINENHLDQVTTCGQWKRHSRQGGGFLTWNPSPEGIPQFALVLPGSFGVDFLLKEPACGIPVPDGFSVVTRSGKEVDASSYGLPDWTSPYYAPSRYWGGSLPPFFTRQVLGGLVIRGKEGVPFLRSALSNLVLFKGIEITLDGRNLTLKGDKLTDVLTAPGKEYFGAVTELTASITRLHLMDRNRSAGYDVGATIGVPNAPVELTELEDVL